MKRTLALLIALLLLAALPLSATAAEEPAIVNDSTYVNSVIRSQIGISEDTMALRIFQVNMLSFADSSDVYDVLPVTWRSSAIIAASEDGINFKFWNRSVYSPTYFSSAFIVDNVALRFYLDADVTTYLGEDTVVNSVFFLHSISTGTAIYYRTNKGNYVYFHHEDIKPCLFSAEAFSDYMQFVKTFQEDDRGNINYKTLRFDVCYLSPYELGSAYFNPNAKHVIPRVSEFFWPIVSVASLVVIAVIIVIIVMVYRKKVKPYNPYEEHQGTRFDSDFVIAHTVNDYVYDPENLPTNPN